MGKGKKKCCGTNKNEPFIAWRTQVQRLEKIYGSVKTPLFRKYKHLREVITIANNATTFVPKSRNGNTVLGEHPYRREIRDFQPPSNYKVTCAQRLLTAPKTPMKIDGQEDFSVVWINTQWALKCLVADLKKRDHIFLDIEGHNVRSFRGITSLLQLLDEEHRTVYFVDTLELYNHVELIGEILTDPKIIKVMHGSHNDIRSFEKDFSLYIVGLIDTQMVFREYYAQCERSGLFNNVNSSNISYKNLVNGILPQARLEKNETFTDFRQRPLHPNQQQYAFLDVWYLPYVYFKMMSELDSSRMLHAVEESKQICLRQRYSFPQTDLHRKEGKELLAANIDRTSKREYCQPPFLTGENDILYQLRRLRHYIALKEDYNPDYLCPPSVLIKLISGGKPYVEPVYFNYPIALQKALRGEDGIHEIETRYSDLGISFPFAPPPTVPTFFCCKHWKQTDHLAKDCSLTKEQVKKIKAEHYLKNPDKKKARAQYVHIKERNTKEKRVKLNKKNSERKKRNQPEGYVRRREAFFQKQKYLQEKMESDKTARRHLNTQLIHDRQVSRGIILRTRKEQVLMLQRQQYRDKINRFLLLEN